MQVIFGNGSGARLVSCASPLLFICGDGGHVQTSKNARPGEQCCAFMPSEPLDLKVLLEARIRVRTLNIPNSRCFSSSGADMPTIKFMNRESQGLRHMVMQLKWRL